MAETYITVPVRCLSTHGGSGYALGDYWDGDDIVCGFCGRRSVNPPPTGSRWVPRKGFWNKLLNRGDGVPRWPDFIRGYRGSKWSR